MNIVFVQHAGSGKKYAFEVPDFLVEYITPGMDVLVKNACGFRVVRVVSGVISGDGALDAAKLVGANEPMQPVISVITNEVFNHIRDEVLESINIWAKIDRNNILFDGLMHCCEIEVNKHGSK